MSASFKINLSTLQTGTTATTINIPITMEYQIVDNAELVERVFVDVETQKAVNPILDYEKVRFTPLDSNYQIVENISYQLSFLVNGSIVIPTYYSDIDFVDSDVKFERNNFKESFLNLAFYDDPNPMIQNLVSEVEIYNHLTEQDHYPLGTPKPNVSGQPKAVNNIPVRFLLSNPIFVPRAFYEGYNLYAYKDEYVIGDLPKYLYMRGTYFNAKNGRVTNLMTEPIAYNINELIDKLYTRYILFRDTTGFYYQIDDTYTTNVTSITNQNNKTDLTVNLYQIQAL